MEILQKHIRRSIKDGVILELQIIVGNLPSREIEVWTGTSTCHQGHGDPITIYQKRPIGPPLILVTRRALDLTWLQELTTPNNQFPDS